MTDEITKENLPEKIIKLLLDIISKIPTTSESEANDPISRTKTIGNKAAAAAALFSGALAIPPGPLGFVTILPDLIGIWKIQAQMVADIAAAFGKKAYLDKNTMLYCLFKHAASQAVRDLLVRVGQRVLIKRASLRVIKNILQKIGVKVTQRVTGRVISRLLPIVGAVGVGAYAYYDTAQVAKTAIDFFSQDIGYVKFRKFGGQPRPSE